MDLHGVHPNHCFFKTKLYRKGGIDGQFVRNFKLLLFEEDKTFSNKLSTFTKTYLPIVLDNEEMLAENMT